MVHDISDYIADIADGLGDMPNVLLYGPPGTSKTFLLQEIRKRLDNYGGYRTTGVSGRFKPISDLGLKQLFNPASAKKYRTWWLTFHQSVSYEDFILGLRPINPEGDGMLELQPRAGPLFEAMEFARKGGTSFIFIDEINRGNLAQILGDFITFMEYGKRLDNDTRQTTMTLPFTPPMLNAGDPDGDQQRSEPIKFRSEPVNLLQIPLTPDFSYQVPRHVYIIATMNSLDRSVAPIDSAIERRFIRIEMRAKPREGDFTGYVDPDQNWKVYPNSPAMQRVVQRMLNNINKAIDKCFIDDPNHWEFHIGPAFFVGVGDWNAWRRAIKYKILPSLSKIFRNYPDEFTKLCEEQGLDIFR